MQGGGDTEVRKYKLINNFYFCQAAQEMQSVISHNYVYGRSNRQITRFIHHSSKILARCSVPLQFP